MMKKLLVAAFLALAPSLAQAQSQCPYIAYGVVLTAAQWQFCFQSKNDALGFTPLNVTGGTLTGPLITVAPTASASGFNIPPGVTPTSPNPGDIWATNAGFAGYIGGQTVTIPAIPATLRFVVTGVNFNVSNNDNPLTISIPVGVSRYKILSVDISNASALMTSSTLGVFTGAGGTGQTIAANQSVSVSATSANANNNMQSLTLTNATSEAYNSTTLYVRTGSAQGSAATADVIIRIEPLT